MAIYGYFYVIFDILRFFYNIIKKFIEMSTSPRRGTDCSSAVVHHKWNLGHSVRSSDSKHELKTPGFGNF